MQRIILSIVMVALAGGVGAVNPSTPPDIDWTGIYGGETTDAGVRLIQTPDSNFAFLGRTISFAVSNDDFYLVKLDSQGDTLWTKTYGGTEGVFVGDLINTIDGGFFMTGYDMNYGWDSMFVARKTDSLGNELWVSQAGYQARGNSAVCTADSGFIVAGFTRDQSWTSDIWGYVVKFDQDGDSVWSITFGTNQTTIIEDAFLVGIDSIMVVGHRSYHSEAGVNHLFAALLASDGTVLWEKDYGDSGSLYALAGEVLNNGKIILVGGVNVSGWDKYLQCTSKAGDSLWSIIAGDTLDDMSLDISASPNGGFYVISASYSLQVYSRIDHYDSLGGQLWSKTLDSLFYEVNVISVAESYDGGLLVGASVSYNSSGPDNDLLALKFATQLPNVALFAIEGSNPNNRLINHTPLFDWSVMDPLGVGNVATEIEVGSDNDWTIAEMWSASVVDTVTEITYNGSSLFDGEKYWLRIRVSNGIDWSPWYESYFHMNSIPSTPIPLNPINDEVVGNTPTLTAQVALDAEGDTLTYEFSAMNDSTCGDITIYEITGTPDGDATVNWQIPTPLQENCKYWWKARAFDGHEHTEWTELNSFYVNATPEAPSAPQANYPPDTGNPPIFDMLPTFTWSTSTDPDPFDTVKYKLEIAVDSNFTFVQNLDSLPSASYTVLDSLNFGTRYWWRVTAFDKTGLSTLSPNTPDFWTWTLGDLDHTNEVNVSDLTMLVAYLFKGGDQPLPPFISDIDGSCSLNVSDLTWLVAYLFKGGDDPGIGCTPAATNGNN